MQHLALALIHLVVGGEPEPIVFREGLLLPRVGQYGRAAIHTDAVEALLVTGRWKTPKVGEQITLPDGTTRAWQKGVADKDGWVGRSGLAGGYALWLVPSEAARVMLLEATGHALVYVNGVPRIGDIYQAGYVRLPVQLRPGVNELLFHCARGRVTARLVAPRGKVLFNGDDAILPDLLAGAEGAAWGSVVVVNASTERQDGLSLQVQGDQLATTSTPLPALPPLGVHKVGFRVRAATPGKATQVEAELTLRRDSAPATPVARHGVRLRVRRPTETHVRTFLSDIDGSVQYYAVNPARPVGKDGPAPALFLSLHGAGVQATGQADAYAPKSWGHLVAPTGRRPFGFDWEDWGRLDALEVLDHAQKELGSDPQRVYLTGHSMGGHGAWHLGVTCPDRFAAIGPSAAWPTFWTYVAGKRPEPASEVARLVQRATNPSDTLALAPNLAPLGVYILHGAADDNVPVGQGRMMRDLLQTFHRDFVYHEQPGAGHWWDDSPEPGVDCVDWAPMFDLFARHVRPRSESVRDVSFATFCPAISARCQWARIEAQIRPLERSSVRLRFDPGRRRFAGKTENVARLALDVGQLRPGAPLEVELDGQKVAALPWPGASRRLWLIREGGKWSATAQPGPALKGPHRYGPFRDAFRNRVLFVYGTRGNEQENAWALAKARLDAETFWYRGNGAVEVLPDTAFDAGKDPDRGVIVYGNAQTNAAWAALLADSPVQVRRDQVVIGARTLPGDDLACLFLRPRPGSNRACVGVVAGSGTAGMRLTDRLPLFLSGVGYPDCTVLGAEMLTQGEPGLRAAGYFGLDWSLASGEFAWRP